MKESLVPNEELPDMQRLISEYGSQLLRMCYLYLHDLHLAEDAVQETYIKVYKNWSSYRKDCLEKTWITAIAINVCKSYLRSSQYKHWLHSANQNPESSYEDKIKDDTVLKEIAGLKPKYKEVILLFYYEQLKVKEIARILHITESAVTVRLTRAREQLKSSLKGWYFNE